MEIKWTNKNVKNLGVYFVNDNPALATYKMINPNLNTRLSYWKQFKLSQIGKARLVEIFLASKLIYAIKFYPMPTNIQQSLQKTLLEYVNFPQKFPTIAQEEMWKTSWGGIKLANIKVKPQTSKVK